MDIKSILAATLSFGDKVSISLTTLLTGFAVVFSVLILLIVIIIILGKVISTAQNKSKKNSSEVEKKPVTVKTQSPKPTTAKKITSDGIPEEIIAVIAAAVDSTYGTGKVRIAGIKKSRSYGGRSAWGQAGVMNNTRPF
ncbi:MAG: OadG family protein [Ruminococcus sp.]|nr:OadG family protein [Ruminococcus sp.]